MKLRKAFYALLVIALVMLGLAVSLASAQEGQTGREGDAPEGVQAVSDYIPVQGRLANASGQALDGDYSVTFRLYAAASGGTALCEDSRSVSVADGLFSTFMRADSCPIDGRQLYLSVEVGDDGEMSPRQYIHNVPYAWSLRPEARVQSETSEPILLLNNTGDGVGLWSVSGAGAGVHGASLVGAGVEGFSFNGPGVYGESLDGAAIAAHGTITSTEPTYLWISGNDVRPFSSGDSTIINLESWGGARIYPGASVGNKNVVLPITIPGTLYGQNVRLTGLNIYWQGDSAFEGITTIRLRRQTGACSGCYVEILANTTDYSCEDSVPPNDDGCVISNVLTTNNVLTPSSGILYLTLELTYGGNTWIDLGGARLTLEYDE